MSVVTYIVTLPCRCRDPKKPGPNKTSTQRRCSGGSWRWDDVPENSRFPDGFHRPRHTQPDRADARWFFATPSVCWEIHFLRFIFGCMARGGLSASAFYDIYVSFWSTGMHGTMFAAREHFVEKLLFAILVHQSMLLLEASDAEALSGFQWHLRPHHQATDFQPLLRKLRAGFDSLSMQHVCPLFDKVPACVIDGKWSIQTPVCNDRTSGLVWDPQLCLGYFGGCCSRPAPGSKYCRLHGECPIAPEDSGIQKHREKQTHDSLSLQYLFQGAWVDAAAVPVENLRAYELTLLRPRARETLIDEPDSCRGLS